MCSVNVKPDGDWLTLVVCLMSQVINVKNLSSAGATSFNDLTLLSNDIPAVTSCEGELELHISDEDDAMLGLLIITLCLTLCCFTDNTSSRSSGRDELQLSQICSAQVLSSFNDFPADLKSQDWRQFQIYTQWLGK